MNKKLFFDGLFNVVGIMGVLCVLSGYFLIQNQSALPTDMIYLCLNIIGSILILFSLIRFWNLPSAMIQSSWIIISLYGLWKMNQL